MNVRNEITEDYPIRTVGSSVFGRYPKISIEETYNMIISDDWQAPYAGYKNILSQDGVYNPISSVGKGRGNFKSSILNKLVIVIYNNVYLVTIVNGTNNVPIVTITLVGSLNTFAGDVFIDEDTQGNIGICDKSDIWIYNISTNLFYRSYTASPSAGLDFIPGYISYHNGRFLSVDLLTSQWRLSDISGSTVIFPNDAQHVGEFQTKGDRPVAVLPFPGKGNLIFVMGSIVTELWTDVGAALFPYQKSSSVNLDYGCLNSDTIAVQDEIICWLSGNSKSGAFIAFSTGGLPERISTDGIDFKLASLKNPKDSHGFLFRQDGHLIYQLVFPSDNFSCIYDFNTKKFFHVTDEKMNYHIAKRVAYLNNTYYFVSLNDGNLYEFDTSITDYNYGYQSNGEYKEVQIPRVRTTNTLRMPDTANYIVNTLAIPFEQGVQDDPPQCDLSISIDGGENFSNSVRMGFNDRGSYINQFTFFGLGMCNEFTLQLRLWSFDRVVMGNGILGAYQ